MKLPPIKIKEIRLSDVLATSSLLIAVLVAFAGSCKDCSQEEKIDKLTFWNTAIQYRPLLKVITPAKVDSFRVRGSARIGVKDMMTGPSSGAPFIEIPSQIELHLTLKATNISKVLAKVYGIVWTDTTTMIDRIREKILSRDTSNVRNLVDSSTFRFIELFPGDTVSFSESRVIEFIKDQKFTIHFYLLYANELDNLYDTYEWITIETAEIVSRPEFRVYEGQLQVRFITEKNQFKDFLNIQETRVSSKTYSQEQSRVLFEVLNAASPFVENE